MMVRRCHGNRELARSLPLSTAGGNAGALVRRPLCVLGQDFAREGKAICIRNNRAPRW